MKHQKVFASTMHNFRYRFSIHLGADIILTLFVNCHILTSEGLFFYERNHPFTFSLEVTPYRNTLIINDLSITLLYYFVLLLYIASLYIIIFL